MEAPQATLYWVPFKDRGPTWPENSCGQQRSSTLATQGRGLLLPEPRRDAGPGRRCGRVGQGARTRRG